jgi:hypothetical protein
VLLAGPPAPFRESLHRDGWPVELFVHTRESLEHYRGADQARRQPTTQRLLGESVLLLDVDGSGAVIARQALAEIEAGPRPLAPAEVAAARYALTDLLEDLLGARDDDERLAVATVLWRTAGDLLLLGLGRWTGTGKGLLRELRSLDDEHGSTWAARLAAGVRAASGGRVEPLVAVVEDVLAPHGGRRFDGHRVGGVTP